jgi:hypothetical protein
MGCCCSNGNVAQISKQLKELELRNRDADYDIVKLNLRIELLKLEMNCQTLRFDMRRKDINHKYPKTLEWITLNPPLDGETTADYYKRYVQRFKKPIHNSRFGELARISSEGYQIIEKYIKTISD